MFRIIRILILVLCAHNSIEASVNSSEQKVNKIVENKSTIENDIKRNQVNQFSREPVDPNIDEDARLSVVHQFDLIEL